MNTNSLHPDYIRDICNNIEIKDLILLYKNNYFPYQTTKLQEGRVIWKSGM